MPKAKHILGSLTFAFAGLTWLYHGHVFERSPPVYGVDGQAYYLHPTNLATCTQAAAFATLGAPGADEMHQRCEDWLRRHGVWDEVTQRWRVLAAGAAMTLIMAAGLLMAIRFEPPPPKIVSLPMRQSWATCA